MELPEALAVIESLRADLKKFEGIDPAQVQRDRQSLSEQLANTQRQFNEFKATAEKEKSELQSQLSRQQTGYQFGDALSRARVLPEYRDRFNDIASTLKVENGKLIDSEGKEFDPSGLRGKYPAMFAPAADGSGSGAMGSNGQASNQSRVVKASDSVVNLDPAQVLSGAVSVEL